jgi:hypothetical protein
MINKLQKENLNFVVPDVEDPKDTNKKEENPYEGKIFGILSQEDEKERKELLFIESSKKRIFEFLKEYKFLELDFGVLNSDKKFTKEDFQEKRKSLMNDFRSFIKPFKIDFSDDYIIEIDGRRVEQPQFFSFTEMLIYIYSKFISLESMRKQKQISKFKELTKES